MTTLWRSIAAQSVRPREIIVVNDASTDRTAEIARQSGAVVLDSQPLTASSPWAHWRNLWRSLETSLTRSTTPLRARIVPGFIAQHDHPILSAITMTSRIISIEDWVLPSGVEPATSTPEEYAAMDLHVHSHDGGAHGDCDICTINHVLGSGMLAGWNQRDQ